MLAIAALIFLLLFVALPHAQRLSRDHQRRQAADQVLASLNVFASNLGHYPRNDGERDRFAAEYPVTFTEPLTGDPFVIRFSPALYFGHIDTPELGEIIYTNGHWCAEEGSGTTVEGADHIFSQVVVVGYTELGGLYCVDNK